MEPSRPNHCTGCGRPGTDCPSGGLCTSRFEPPRYCRECGRRLRVLVKPTGWRAECRDHGPAGTGVPPVTAPVRAPAAEPGRAGT